MQKPFWTKTWLMIGIALVALALAATPVLAIEAPPQKDSTVAPAQQVQQEPAAPESGNQLQSSTLLQDWFGVNLELTNTLSGGNNNWSFVLDSFEPTRRLETANWVQADWYGNWNPTSFTQSTVRGAAPSGGEWYDVEALYFDNDEENIYIVVVTSFPFEGRDLLGSTYSDVGLKDTRISPAIWVRPGDLSLNLGLNSTSGWSYDFGVNVANELRPDSGNIAAMRNNNLDYRTYKTQNDAWYLGHPQNAPTAQGELTNFDPEKYPDRVVYRTNATVNYYKLPFYDNNSLEIKENGADTWVIEVTLPRASLAYDGHPNGPVDGETIKIRWASSCRNDASGTNGVISLTGTVRLGLTKSVSPELFQVPTGSTAPLIATYTFVVSNPKATPLTNVTLVDEFTAFSYGADPVLYCLSFIDVTASREGVIFSSNIPLQANLGTLAPGEAVIITLRVDVKDCGLGTFPNTAVADSTETAPISDDASITIEPQPSAVELARFEAAAQAESILLEWETASELDNLGFNLYRSTALNGDYVQLNAALIPTQNPGAVFGGIYTWVDEDVTPGVTYFYKLEDVDIYGVATLHGPVQATALAAGPSAVRIASFSAGGAGWTLPAALSALALLSLKRRRK